MPRRTQLVVAVCSVAWFLVAACRTPPGPTEPSQPGRSPMVEEEPAAMPQIPPPDTTGVDPDGDGLVAPADRCPDMREDADGVADADGCPDLDDDRDHVEDLADQCPDVVEPSDGADDADGCPP